MQAIALLPLENLSGHLMVVIMMNILYWLVVVSVFTSMPALGRVLSVAQAADFGLHGIPSKKIAAIHAGMDIDKVVELLAGAEYNTEVHGAGVLVLTYPAYRLRLSFDEQARVVGCKMLMPPKKP